MLRPSKAPGVVIALVLLSVLVLALPENKCKVTEFYCEDMDEGSTKSCGLWVPDSICLAGRCVTPANCFEARCGHGGDDDAYFECLAAECQNAGRCREMPWRGARCEKQGQVSKLIAQKRDLCPLSCRTCLEAPADGYLEPEFSEDVVPGIYVVKAEHMWATKNRSVLSAPLSQLLVGSEVNVVEVAVSSEEREIRGRIEDPAGWISIEHMEGYRSAVPLAEWEELHNVTSTMAPVAEPAANVAEWNRLGYFLAFCVILAFTLASYVSHRDQFEPDADLKEVELSNMDATCGSTGSNQGQAWTQLAATTFNSALSGPRAPAESENWDGGGASPDGIKTFEENR